MKGNNYMITTKWNYRLELLRETNYPASPMQQMQLDSRRLLPGSQPMAQYHKHVSPSIIARTLSNVPR